MLGRWIRWISDRMYWGTQVDYAALAWCYPLVKILRHPWEDIGGVYSWAGTVYTETRNTLPAVFYLVIIHFYILGRLCNTSLRYKVIVVFF